MILSFLMFTLAVVMIFALVFKFLPEHLGAFLKLALTCRTTFTFIVSPFITGGFPAFKSLCHTQLLCNQFNFSKIITRSQVEVMEWENIGSRSIVERIEATRNRVLHQAERIQQETQKRLKSIKQQAQKQAIAKSTDLNTPYGRSLNLGNRLRS